ncbi:unnamed protein product, partial [Symbiodinium sp. CCMP2456]
VSLLPLLDDRMTYHPTCRMMIDLGGLTLTSPFAISPGLRLRLLRLDRQDSQKIMDIIRDCAPGAVEGVFDSVTALRPQRLYGYLYVIRFPSIIRGMQEGFSAVVLDLTRVGGHYFATVLPSALSLDQLESFVRPLTHYAEEPLFFFVGFKTRPWPREAIVDFHDGDVVTVVRDASTIIARYRAEAMFLPGAEWCPLHHFFDFERHEATCVTYQDRRYCVRQYHHYGETLVEHVTGLLRLDSKRIVLCSFPICDLDVQGELCTFLVAVHDLPEDAHEPGAAPREDIFVLCDFRPLGLKPRVVHTHVPLLHIPSVASDFGIILPGVYTLGTVGGRRRGDRLRVEPNSTILFYAQPIASDSSSSSAEDPPEPAPDAQEDPTLPPGHSWNAGESSSTARPAASSQHSHVWGDSWTGTSAYGETTVAREDPVACEAPPTGPTEAESPPVIASGSGYRNRGPRLRVSAPPDVPTADVAVETEDAIAVRALVYVPDVTPELLQVTLPLPCSLQQALTYIQEARSQDSRFHYPVLAPVVPQPAPSYIACIALPEWAVERPVVVFDCQRVDLTFFASLASE